MSEIRLCQKGRHKFICSVFLGLLVFFVSWSQSIGQITEAALKGTAVDIAGNAIVASAVTAQNEATSQIATTTTADNGDFVFASLPSGSYTIYMRVLGFKTYEL